MKDKKGKKDEAKKQQLGIILAMIDTTKNTFECCRCIICSSSPNAPANTPAAACGSEQLAEDLLPRFEMHQLPSGI
jgi:hypothetical protein